MLSGFVLMHAYGAKLTRAGSAIPFFRDRVVRLYPMLILGAALGFVVALKGHEASAHTSLGQTALGTIANALGLPDLTNDRPFWINPPTWSLFFELVVNAIFVGTAFAFTPRRLLAAVVIFVAAMVALDLYYGSFAFGWIRADLGAGLVRVCVSFTIGVLLHYLHNRGVLANGGKRWWVAPILVASFFALSTNSPQSIIYDPIIVLCVYPILILASAGSKDIIPAVAKMSGALSYPFYVIHMPVLRLMQFGIKRLGFEQSKVSVITSLILAIGITWLVLKFYDEPVRRYLRRRLA